MPAYNVCESGESSLDILEVDDLRIAVSRSGAEMVSLARKDRTGQWQGFLYRDGETGPAGQGWGNHATVMGYFLHRLWHEQSTYRGKTIKGGNHGFLRHFAFAAPEAGASSLTYRVPASAVPPDAYPLRVSLALTYALSTQGLRVEFLFTNEEPSLDAHVSFGLHPGFAVSSPKTCRLILPAGVYLRQMAPGNFLNGKVEEIDFAGGDLPFDREKLPDSYILSLERVENRVFLLEDAGLNRRIELDFSEVPYVTIWSDMNPFLCVEPCWGLPDSNPPRPFEEKAGIQRIPAGGSLRAGFTLNPGFLS